MSAESKPPVTPLPAATILLLRDAPGGLEVFMVKRHHQIDFVAGALVFPGGRVDKGDSEAALQDHADGGSDWNEVMRAMGAAAIREAFEELEFFWRAMSRSDALVPRSGFRRSKHLSQGLEKREVTLVEMLRRNNCGSLTINSFTLRTGLRRTTCPSASTRTFFLARSPFGHAGSHDGPRVGGLDLDHAGQLRNQRSQEVECDLSDEGKSDEACGVPRC